MGTRLFLFTSSLKIPIKLTVSTTKLFTTSASELLSSLLPPTVILTILFLLQCLASQLVFDFQVNSTQISDNFLSTWFHSLDSTFSCLVSRHSQAEVRSNTEL